MSAGKGSAPRPFDIPREVYESNHDRIFGKRERKQWIPPEIGCNRMESDGNGGSEPVVDGYQETGDDQ